MRLVRDDARQLDIPPAMDMGGGGVVSGQDVDDERALFQRYALAVLWRQTTDPEAVRRSLAGTAAAAALEGGLGALGEDDVRWTSAAGWMSPAGLCTWHGVICHPHESLGDGPFDGDFYVGE